MATRIYLRSEGTPDLTPSTWNFANQVNPVSLPGTLIKNSGSTMTSKTEATGTTNPIALAMGRTIIGPLKAQTISGTVKGQMRGSESNSGANATLALAVKIIKADGTDRAVLLAQTASDAATAGHELATVLTNMSFQDAAESASISLTSQSASDGDYLVIEWGFRSATSVSRNITLSYGNDSTTDLPEDTSTTNANNPWVEFSATIAMIRTGVGSSAGLGGSSVVGAATAQGAASSAGTVGGSTVGASFAAGSASSDGLASMSGVGAVVIAGNGSCAGVGALDGVGAITYAGIASSDGLAVVLGAFAADIASVGFSSGLSDGSAIGAAQVAGLGDANGASSLNGISVSIASGDGSAAGLSSCNSQFAVIAGVDGVSDSQAAVSFVGASIVSSAGAAAGLTIANYLALALAQGDGSCQASSSVSISSAELHWGLGFAESVSSADWVAGSEEGSIAVGLGLGVGLAVGNALRAAVFSAQGAATVSTAGKVVAVPSVSINMPSESRTLTIQGESRGGAETEQRITTVTTEKRTVALPAEPRIV